MVSLAGVQAGIVSCALAFGAILWIGWEYGQSYVACAAIFGVLGVVALLFRFLLPTEARFWQSQQAMLWQAQLIEKWNSSMLKELLGWFTPIWSFLETIARLKKFFTKPPPSRPEAAGASTSPSSPTTSRTERQPVSLASLATRTIDLDAETSHRETESLADGELGSGSESDGGNKTTTRRRRQQQRDSDLLAQPHERRSQPPASSGRQYHDSQSSQYYQALHWQSSMHHLSAGGTMAGVGGFGGGGPGVPVSASGLLGPPQ